MKQPLSAPALDQLRPFSIVVLGAAVVLAAATNVIQGAVLGCTGALVLILVGLVMKLARRFLPAARLVPWVVVTAVVVTTVVGSMIQAFNPALRRGLGMYLPLQAVSCLVLGLTIGTGSENRGAPGIRALLIPAVQYAVLVAALGLVREAFGQGTVLGWPLFGSDFQGSPVLILSLAPGGFMILGFGAGLYRRIRQGRRA